MLKIKSIPARVKDVDVKSRTVQGYFSVFDNIDSDGDIIERGAFSKTIKERGVEGSNRIKHLWQHNPMQPLSKPKELREDETGLFFTSEITDTSYGIDAIKLYRDGVVDEHSIGFEIMNSQPETHDGENIQMLTEIRLWEGSTVTWGANELAIGGMKGNSVDYLLERYKTLKKALESGDYRDDTYKLIEKQIEWISLKYTESAVEPLSTQPEPPCTPSKIDALFSQYTLKHKIKEQFNVKGY